MMCVLIVEDNPVSRKFVESYLHKCGIDTIAADTGKKTVEYLESHGDEIQLILLDIMLPDMDGFELLKLKNDHPACKDIPVI